MHKPSWQAVVISLEYAIQFEAEPESKSTLAALFQFVIANRAYPFSVKETQDALRLVRAHPEQDLSKLLPQRHSDNTLRRTFDALGNILAAMPAA